MRQTRRSLLKRGGAAIGAMGLGSIAGCSGGGGTVAASSMQWSEAALLGEMGYLSVKENTDLTVKDKLELGGAMQNFKATKSGSVDWYHMYTAGAWATLPPKKEEIPRDPKVLYQKAKEKLKTEHNLIYLDRATYNNTYALALSPEFAKAHDFSTIADFASYITNGNTDVTVVLGPEFAVRDDGWIGLSKAYGFAGVRSDLNIKKVSANLTYQILGNNEADVGMVFSTNPQIKKYDLTVLEDNKQFFAPYNPAPLVNGNTLKQYPEIKSPLEAPMHELTSEEQVIELNAKVVIDGKDRRKVARTFLKNKDII